MTVPGPAGGVIGAHPEPLAGFKEPVRGRERGEGRLEGRREGEQKGKKRKKGEGRKWEEN